jgi:hypothetical protein
MHTPMSNERMQSAMKELRESMAILAHIERTQSLSRELGPPSTQSENLHLRIEKNLAEITEKLNRLIGPQ